MTEKKQDRIDDYLLGRSADRAAFEQDLTQDPELAAGLESTRRALDAIEVAGRADMKARLQAMEADMRGGKTGKGTEGATIRQLGDRSAPATVRKLPVTRLLAYAAALLLLLTAGWFLLRNGDSGGDNLYALAEFEPDDNLAYSITKSADELPGEGATLAAAYTAYEAGDMELAAERLAALPATPVNRYYLGQAQLALENFPAAAELFADLRGEAEFQLAPESTYYLAVARLGLNDRAGAMALLEEILSLPSHPSFERADRLMRRLR